MPDTNLANCSGCSVLAMTSQGAWLCCRDDVDHPLCAYPGLRAQNAARRATASRVPRVGRQLRLALGGT